MCTRTVGVLARVFEEAGMATTSLSLIREQAENIKAPRFLHCEFPLGRPLGKPGDAEFLPGQFGPKALQHCRGNEVAHITTEGRYLAHEGCGQKGKLYLRG